MYALKEGTNTVGRAPHVNVKIPSSGVSKEHAKIDVLDSKIIIADLGSRNGTFVNGVQIKSQRLKTGDKIAFHDIMTEVHELTVAQFAQYSQLASQMKKSPRANVAYDAAVVDQHIADEVQPMSALQPESMPVARQKIELITWFKNYMETAVLPGVYRLPEILEFRLVLLGFMGAFILFTTALSSIPLMTILKTSIEKESQRRALTIARTLAQINRPALMQGIDSSLSVEIATREPGVSQALIISQVDGNVMAPAALAGTYPDLPFIHEARKMGKEAVEQISGSRIAALVPIDFFNAETGNNQIAAHAVIIYDMGTLAVDDGRTLSLFIQTFAIAILIGGILFFFMYKIIEHPIDTLNLQLDVALREGQQDISTKYLFPALAKLVSNINSALHRVGNNGPAMVAQERDRHSEMTNIVELMGFPALSITAHDQTVTAVNQPFEERTGISAAAIVHNNIERVTDQALKLSLKDLIDRLIAAPDQMATNDLEFSGMNYQIAGQAVYGNEKIAYFLFVILPAEGGEAQ
jgi:hypothetical protein